MTRKPLPAPVRPRPPMVVATCLPGDEPQPFAPAIGYLLPMPTTVTEHAAMLEVQTWLRSAGFSPAEVPYPMRLVVGDGRMLAHCRVATPRPGFDARVWRAGATGRPFPDHLLGVLNADQVCGPASGPVAELIAAAKPNTTIKEKSC